VGAGRATAGRMGNRGNPGRSPAGGVKLKNCRLACPFHGDSITCSAFKPASSISRRVCSRFTSTAYRLPSPRATSGDVNRSAKITPPGASKPPRLGQQQGRLVRVGVREHAVEGDHVELHPDQRDGGHAVHEEVEVRPAEVGLAKRHGFRGEVGAVSTARGRRGTVRPAVVKRPVPQPTSSSPLSGVRPTFLSRSSFTGISRSNSAWLGGPDTVQKSPFRSAWAYRS